MRAQIALIQAGSTLSLAGGTTTGPLIVELRLDLNWRRGTGVGEHPIGLGAIAIRATITPDPVHPAFQLQVVLEQLQLTADPVIDKVLDTADLGRDAPSLLTGLLKVVLADAGADPTAIALSNHLLGLFGLDDSGAIPVFPFAQLADGPQALQQWLGSLIGGSAPSSTQWLQHFAGLFGSAIAVEGPSTGPWSVRLLPLGGVGGFSLTLENIGQQARFGVQASLGASLGAGQPHAQRRRLGGDRRYSSRWNRLGPRAAGGFNSRQFYRRRRRSADHGCHRWRRHSARRRGMGWIDASTVARTA
jgi:hypothetical protein